MADLSLIEAVKAGDRAKAESLIQAGADANQVEEQGWTPLNFAAGKGDLGMVKMLVEKGAEIFKVGRDQRTPYMIALAAGRVSVVKYLREVEDNYPGEKPARPERKYCKAYHLGDLRKYPNWTEGRINWKEKKEKDRNKPKGQNGGAEGPFLDDKVVFIHQDFTVTESMWHNENVLFNEIDSGWKDFCADSLKFKVPDDLDLIVPNEPA
ncbi:MAG TPA: ankyrin repeat domain-containing protein [Blastocatellia bacterium]